MEIYTTRKLAGKGSISQNANLEDEKNRKVEMSLMINKLTNGIHWIARIFFYLGWVSISFMLLGTCYDVMMRYVFANPTSWVVELNSVLLVYVAFLCAAELVAKGQHIDMDVLVTRLSNRVRKSVDILNAVVAFLFCVVLTWMGSITTLTTYRYGIYTSGDFHMPLWLIYIPIPLGSLFIGLEYMLRIIETAKRGTDGH